MMAALAIFALAFVPDVPPRDGPGLAVADLEAYRSALRTSSPPSAPIATFRDLWDHPEAHAGRPVVVEGRMARRFRQPGIGEFPPLVEAWIVSPAGDPTCLVFPDAPDLPEIGASVRFNGTFLRLIRYQGGDVPRLSPLVVGPASPRPTLPPLAPRPGSSTDWMIGLGAGAAVLLFLARRHLARPPARPPVYGPNPRFIDQEGADHDDP